MPGTPADRMPPGPESFVRRLEQLERAVRELRAGIGGQGFIVGADNPIRSSDFDGDVSAGNPGTTGWGLEGDGAAFAGDVAIGGDMTVTGQVLSDNFDATHGYRLNGTKATFHDVEFLAGVIGDDALASIVKVQSPTPDIQTGWATSTSMVDKASITDTCPAGVSTAIIIALGQVVFQDTAPNRFDSRCKIGGTVGPTIISLASNVGNAAPSQIRVASVTPGGTTTVSVQVLSAVATGGQPANQAVISAAFIYLR